MTKGPTTSPAGSPPLAEDHRELGCDARSVETFDPAPIEWRSLAGLLVSISPAWGEVTPDFFWGAADLAVTRFSGRPAPKHPGGRPNGADWVMEPAHSQPDGFAAWPVTPDAASFDEELGEFILPYAAVRTAPDPDALLLELLQSAYDAAATLGGWDRMALEVRPSWAGPVPGA